MKRNTPDHPKVTAFAAELDVPQYVAVGLLEMLWHWTAKYASRGDIGRYPDGAIARGISWDKDASTLINALVKCRWLDVHQTHRLLIHDWPDHAEDAVHVALYRSADFFANGRKPRPSRLSQKERLIHDEKYAAKDSGSVVGTEGTQVGHAVGTEGTRGEHRLGLGLSLGLSPSPSSSPEGEGGEQKTDQKNPRPRVERRKSGANPNVSLLITHYSDGFKARYGVTPTIVHGRDGAKAAAILAAVKNDLGSAKRIVDGYLSDADDFATSSRHAFPLLAARIDRYRVPAASVTLSTKPIERLRIYDEEAAA